MGCFPNETEFFQLGAETSMLIFHGFCAVIRFSNSKMWISARRAFVRISAGILKRKSDGNKKKCFDWWNNTPLFFNGESVARGCKPDCEVSVDWNRSRKRQGSRTLRLIRTSKLFFFQNLAFDIKTISDAIQIDRLLRCRWVAVSRWWLINRSDKLIKLFVRLFRLPAPCCAHGVLSRNFWDPRALVVLNDCSTDGNLPDWITPRCYIEMSS